MTSTRHSNAWMLLLPFISLTTLLQLFWSLRLLYFPGEVIILPMTSQIPLYSALPLSVTQGNRSSTTVLNTEDSAPSDLISSNKNLRQINPALSVRDTSSSGEVARYDVNGALEETSSTESPVIDAISIGSLTRTAYQDAQQATWASHVRNFVRVDERNDTETDCHKMLTTDQVVQVSQHCHSQYTANSHLDLIREFFVGGTYLSEKANPAGWLCAQKRPMDGLRVVLDLYRNQPLPDYLIIADDDTWVNMPLLTQELLQSFPSHQATAVAGCRMRWSMKKSHNPDFTIPFGGFGSILTRAALERLIRPIHCEDDDEWIQSVCRRMQENSIGEQPLFRPGMSVADLMLKYTFDQPYLDVAKWNDVGFCLHSDWNLAFYVIFYGISEGEDVDRIRLYRESETVLVRRRRWVDFPRGECHHMADDSCSPDAHICHYVTPDHMEWLHGETH